MPAFHSLCIFENGREGLRVLAFNKAVIRYHVLGEPGAGDNSNITACSSLGFFLRNSQSSRIAASSFSCSGGRPRWSSANIVAFWRQLKIVHSEKQKTVPVTVIFASWSGPAAAAAVAGAGTP